MIIMCISDEKDTPAYWLQMFYFLKLAHEHMSASMTDQVKASKCIVI